MSQIDPDVLAFLLQQIEWHKEQDLILAKIEGKLQAMRELALYRLTDELSSYDIQSLGTQLTQLQQEILVLEWQLDKRMVH